jgi:tetratricopeptide (TPR) repeat protein
MEKERVIDLVRDCYRKRRFAKAKQLIQQAATAGFRSVEFLKYSALIALLEGDEKSASIDLERVRKVEEDDPEVLNALAYIHLKRKETEEALDLWLEILDVDPANKLAKKNLQRMKHMTDVDAFVSKAKPEPFVLGRGVSFLEQRSILLGLGILLVALLAVFVLPELPRNEGQDARKSYGSIRLPSTDDFVLEDRNALYTFESSDVPRLFRDAKKDLRKRQYNSFLIRLNKVLHSNVKDAVKERFILLAEFLPVPSSYEEIKTPIRLTEIFNQQTIYENCYLVLNGKVENLKVTGNATTFNMRQRDQDTGEAYLVRVQNEGRLEALKNGVDVRVLCRFRNVVKSRGVILVEAIKVWLEQKEFMEVQRK